jgi:hypothetical protein
MPPLDNLDNFGLIHRFTTNCRGKNIGGNIIRGNAAPVKGKAYDICHLFFITFVTFFIPYMAYNGIILFNQFDDRRKKWKKLL